MIKEKETVYDDEIDLLQLFLVIWTKKKFILTMCILSVAISLIISIQLYPTKKIVKKDFFVNFSGIENYKNPDGSNFNKEQIISPLILKNAYNKLKNKYTQMPFTFEYLNNNIYLKEIIPEAIKKEIDKENKVYYPNHFELYINRLDDNEIYDKVLYEILLEYKIYFEDYYTKSIYFSKIPKDKIIDEYDYIDLINIIKNNIKSVQIFIDDNLSNNEKNNKIINSKYFVECYNIYNANKLIDKKLELAITEIEQNYITKNNVFFIQKLSEEIKQKILNKNIEKAKLDGANEIIKNLVNIDKSKNNLSKGTNFSLDGDFIEKQVQNNYYSFLIKNILDYTIKYRKLTAEIEFLKDKLNSWSINSKKNKDNLKSIILNEILSLIDEYNKNVDNLNQILEKSFKEKFVDDINFSSSKSLYQNIFNKKIITNTIIAGVCALLLSIFLVFIYEYFKKNKEKLLLK